MWNLVFKKGHCLRLPESASSALWVSLGSWEYILSASVGLTLLDRNDWFVYKQTDGNKGEEKRKMCHISGTDHSIWIWKSSKFNLSIILFLNHKFFRVELFLCSTSAHPVSPAYFLALDVLCWSFISHPMYWFSIFSWIKAFQWETIWREALQTCSRSKSMVQPILFYHHLYFQEHPCLQQVYVPLLAPLHKHKENIKIFRMIFEYFTFRCEYLWHLVVLEKNANILEQKEMVGG